MILLSIKMVARRSGSFTWLLLVWSAVVVSVQSTCPFGCRCENNEIKCVGVNALPVLSSNTTKLLLENCHELDTIPANAFASYPSLREIFIDGTQRPLDIKPHAFRGFNGNKIAITKSNIAKLVKYSMSGLENLSLLSLRRCRISTIESDAFAGSGNIQSVVLSVNPLRHIHANAFRGLSNVVDLVLSNTAITKVTSNMFSGTENIAKIYLTGNRILRRVEEKAFLGLNNVGLIKLDSSAVQEIEPRAFEGLGANQHVNVSFRDNQLTTFNCSTFDRLSGRVNFDFSGNRFSCDCRMSWVISEAAPHHLSTVKCHAPRRFQSQRLNELDADKLPCYGMTKNQGCNDPEKTKVANSVTYNVGLTSLGSRPSKEGGKGSAVVVGTSHCMLMALFLVRFL